MGNFFGNLNDKVQNFLVGRNGPDRLARWVLGASVVMLFVNMFVPNVVCTMLSYALLFYCVYRMFSTNVAARRQENERFEEFLGKFSRKGGSGPSQRPGQDASPAKRPAAPRKADGQKTTFACERCGQSLSVPKGRGTLKVTCPKCNHQQKVKS